MTQTHVVNTDRINVYCDEKLIKLRLIKHLELALLFLSDAVKLEKIVCEWVCMLWVGGLRQKTVVWMHISWNINVDSVCVERVTIATYSGERGHILHARSTTKKSGAFCYLFSPPPHRERERERERERNAQLVLNSVFRLKQGFGNTLRHKALFKFNFFRDLHLCTLTRVRWVTSQVV